MKGTTFENKCGNGSLPIDFVLLKHRTEPQVRFSDSGWFRQWLHNVRDFAPWVRNIFIVSDDDAMEFKDEKAFRIIHVLPSEILPESAAPSRNGHAIQANLHHIPNLADRFVVFFENQFLSHPTVPQDWFRNGLPVDSARMGHAIATYHDFGNSYIALNEDAAIQQHFGGRRFVLRHAWKWLSPWRAGMKASFWNAVFVLWGPCPGFRPASSPVPFLRSSFDSAWALEKPLLMATTERKTPDMKDLSIRFFRVWQFATGTFFPCPPSVAEDRAKSHGTGGNRHEGN